MRIAVAMSGGVDSSVAAALLAEQGHDLIGLSMQLFDRTAEGDGLRSFGSCCAVDDVDDARRVAAALNIPHYVLNFERQFAERVVSNFVEEYCAGRTPLPCIRCNSDLKFTALIDRARGMGADALATGHYARIDYDGTTGQYLLRRANDPTKDQSYFLFSLTQAQLMRVRFPVGDRSKNDVRAYARCRGLPVANKPDSQELCFIQNGDYAAFVATHAPEVAREGSIVDQRGRVLGHHDGIHRFTIGQRKGLGLSRSPTGAPLYVVAIRAGDRQVVVGPKAALERRTLTVSDVNWIGRTPHEPLHAAVQIRHRHRAASAIVRATDTARAVVVFDTPQLAVTPGQAAVFYDGDFVVGGGWIDCNSDEDPSAE
jgi:tRNA-specific 2-thiouridylase